MTGLYAQLPLPTATASVGSGTNSSGGSSSSAAAWTSWCSKQATKNAPLPKPSLPGICWRSCMSFPPKSVVSADTIDEAKRAARKRTAERKQKTTAKKAMPTEAPGACDQTEEGEPTEKPEKHVIMRKYRIRLGVEPREGETQTECRRRQDSQLREWAGAARFTYNQAVMSTRPNPNDAEKRPMPFSKDLMRQRFTATSVRDVGKWADVRKELGFEVGELVNTTLDKKKKMENEKKGLKPDSPDWDDPRWLLRTPGEIRFEAVRDVIKAEQSNRAKKQIEIARRAQHIAEGRAPSKCQKVHSWTLKPRKRSNPSAWTMGITNQCIRNVSVRPRPERRKGHADGRFDVQNAKRRRDWTRFELVPAYGLGPLWLTEAVVGGKIGTDCRLTLDHCGKWHLVVPTPVDPPPPTVQPRESRRVVALDPGECIFQMAYSVDETIAYGNKAADDRASVARKVAAAAAARAVADVAPPGSEEAKTARNRRQRMKRRLAWHPGNGGSDRIMALCLKVDSVVKRLKNGADCCRTEYNLRNQAHRLRRKVRNLVDDAHRRVALDLVRKYDTIPIPKFNTGEMTRRKGEDGRRRKLRSKIARSMLNWSHFRFRQFLIHKALRHGKEVVVCTERYTSKACTCCGKINNVSGRWYKCNFCGHQGHRDGCAARNIMLQYARGP